MSSMAPPAKRARTCAPPGSVANNPFRMLPSELVTEIREMKKGFVPTPSAQAIHEAGLRFERNAYGDLEVSIARPRGGGFFKNVGFGDYPELN